MAAPIGNQNAAKAKQWTAAIERALARRAGKAKAEALDDLADKFLDAVEEGQIAAWKEFGDRLEGKPEARVVMAGDADNPVQMKATVEFVNAGSTTQGA